MYTNQELGQLGEKLAKRFLEEREYKIICQNFRSKQGEIDIIAKDKDGTLVSTKQWNLQVLFPESFLNTEIEILGLVGQKKEINADEKVQHIFWTPLVSIPVEDANHTIHDNKFYVNIPKGTNGIDYGYFK